MKIAVIGGIGSGKSQVMSAFAEAGFTVLSADKINSELWQDDSYVNTLKINFPEAVVDGVITKKTLGNLVFSDEKKREKLNNIAHPLIISKILECEDVNVAVELPLAMESGILDRFDRIVLVDTKKSLRLQRLEGRGVSPERAEQIMAVQVPVKVLEDMAHVVITNNGTLDELIEKAMAVALGLKR